MNRDKKFKELSSILMEYKDNDFKYGSNFHTKKKLIIKKNNNDFILIKKNDCIGYVEKKTWMEKIKNLFNI